VCRPVASVVVDVVRADCKEGAGGVVEAPVVDGRVRRPSPRNPTLGPTVVVADRDGP